MRAFWLHNSDNHRESFYDSEKTSHILSNIGSRILHFTAATSEQPLSTRFDFSGFDFSLFLAWDGVHIEQRSQYRLFAFPAFLIPLNLVCLSFISTFYGVSVDSGEVWGGNYSGDDDQLL